MKLVRNIVLLLILMLGFYSCSKNKTEYFLGNSADLKMVIKVDWCYHTNGGVLRYIKDNVKYSLTIPGTTCIEDGRGKGKDVESK